MSLTSPEFAKKIYLPDLQCTVDAVTFAIACNEFHRGLLGDKPVYVFRKEFQSQGQEAHLTAETFASYLQKNRFPSDRAIDEWCCPCVAVMQHDPHNKKSVIAVVQRFSGPLSSVPPVFVGPGSAKDFAECLLRFCMTAIANGTAPRGFDSSNWEMGPAGPRMIDSSAAGSDYQTAGRPVGGDMRDKISALSSLANVAALILEVVCASVEGQPYRWGEFLANAHDPRGLKVQELLGDLAAECRKLLGEPSQQHAASSRICERYMPELKESVQGALLKEINKLQRTKPPALSRVGHQRAKSFRDLSGRSPSTLGSNSARSLPSPSSRKLTTPPSADSRYQKKRSGGRSPQTPMFARSPSVQGTPMSGSRGAVTPSPSHSSLRQSAHSHGSAIPPPAVQSKAPRAPQRAAAEHKQETIALAGPDLQRLSCDKADALLARALPLCAPSTLDELRAIWHYFDQKALALVQAASLQAAPASNLSARTDDLMANLCELELPLHQDPDCPVTQLVREQAQILQNATERRRTYV